MSRRGGERKNKAYRKLLAVMLCAMTLFCAIPTGVSYAADTSGTQPVTQVTDTTDEDSDSGDDLPTGHVHQWEPVKESIYYEAAGHYETVVIMDAYDETVYELRDCGVRCKDCGAVFANADEWQAFSRSQFDLRNYSHGSYEVIYDQISTSVHYDAITAEVWIEDSPAYTEEVIIGYACECGERK